MGNKTKKVLEIKKRNLDAARILMKEAQREEKDKARLFQLARRALDKAEAAAGKIEQRVRKLEEEMKDIILGVVAKKEAPLPKDPLKAAAEKIRRESAYGGEHFATHEMKTLSGASLLAEKAREEGHKKKVEERKAKPKPNKTKAGASKVFPKGRAVEKSTRVAERTLVKMGLANNATGEIMEGFLKDPDSARIEVSTDEDPTGLLTPMRLKAMGAPVVEKKRPEPPPSIETISSKLCLAIEAKFGRPVSGPPYVMDKAIFGEHMGMWPDDIEGVITLAEETFNVDLTDLTEDMNEENTVGDLVKIVVKGLAKKAG